MHTKQDLDQTRRSIAELYARREQLKQALNSGALATHTGLMQLEVVDLELSALDSLFKTLWDAKLPGISRPAPYDSAQSQVSP